MRSLSLFTLGAITASAVAQRVVPLSFSRGGSHNKPLNKRAGAYAQQLSNNLTGGGYFADVALGTPPQPVTLILDTGSSDVWVLDSSADLCQSRALQARFGDCLDTFDSANSSTYEPLNQVPFSIQYLDGSGAEGIYMKDNFHIAGASIEALQIGLAENTTINSGLLGIGFDSNVAAQKTYRNIIDLFVDQDLIHTQAYSLYLNDLDAEIGTILFGGIDTKKFIGELKVVDILPDPQSKTYSSFTVSLDSLKVASGPNSAGDNYLQAGGIPVILDSGTTLTYLPPSVASQIFELLGAVDDSENSGYVFINCDVLTSMKDTTVDFQFADSNGPVVRVPMNELVLDDVDESLEAGLELPPLPFDNVCSFGIQALSGTYLLGDTFLRSAYVVYDLSDKKIALAQANQNDTDTNVIEITTSGIPLVSGVASQVPSTPTAHPKSANSNSDSDSASSSSSGSSTGSGSGSGSASGPGPSTTGAHAPNESTTDSPAVRVAPASNWEVVAVTLVATLCSLTGVTLFMF